MNIALFLIFVIFVLTLKWDTFAEGLRNAVLWCLSWTIAIVDKSLCFFNVGHSFDITDGGTKRRCVWCGKITDIRH